MNTKNVLHLILAIAFTGLTACETTYHPTGEYGGIPHGGYYDTKVDANTYIVNFDATMTPQMKINKYVLYRAAKLTLYNGYTYFIVISSSTNGTNTEVHEEVTQDQIQPPKMSESSRYTTKRYVYSQTSQSQFYHPCCKSPYTLMNHLSSKTSTVVIKMFDGTIPPGIPNAYDPYDIITHMESYQN